MSELINATCPECRGPLEKTEDPVEFRCLVGHRYSPEALLHAHYEAQERALWAAVVALEEARNIVNRVSSYIRPQLVESVKQEAEHKLQQAKAIRKTLEELRPFIIE